MANKKDGLTPKQLEAIRLLCYEKMSVIDTARAIKVSKVSIFGWFGDLTFLNQYNKTLDEIQQQAQAKAMAKIIELAESDNKKIALLASQDILNRVGRKAVDKQEIEHKGISISIGNDDD